VTTAPPPEEPRPFADLWRSDVHRIYGRATRGDLVRLLWRDRMTRPLLTARLCQATPRGGALRELRHWVLRRLHVWSQAQGGMELPWEADIGPGLTLVHGWGLVVSHQARIGANVTLFHGVTIGRKDDIEPDGSRSVGGAPTIEDGVWIGPHALVVGDITVGRGSRIGGGAVVTKDVPPGSLVTGNPGRVVASDVPPDTPNPWPTP
jgi:serine O-acetyltransferase